MRPLLIAALALLFPAGLEAAENRDVAALAHPDLIIVRQFTTPGRIVTLDPSLGFSLFRGKPGVPPARRAASVARAASFILADTITQQLRKLGYDVVQSNEAGPEPGGRALILSGAFRSINEGHRRRSAGRDASVGAAAEIDYQTSGAKPQRITTFQLDSRQLLHQRRNAVAQREPGVNSAAMRLGIMIAGAVAEQAHRSNWPGAPVPTPESESGIRQPVEALPGSLYPSEQIHQVKRAAHARSGRCPRRSWRKGRRCARR